MKGKEAIEKALAEIPHLILLDVMMPGNDGVETCEEIHTYSQYKFVDE